MVKTKTGKAGKPVWGKKREKLFLKLYPVTDNAEIARKLSYGGYLVTVSAVRNAAIFYKVKKSSWYWDDKWKNYVLANWDSKQPIEIAKGLKKKFNVKKTRWGVINIHRKIIKSRQQQDSL